MTKIELAEKAINFAMRDLCGGYLDMPSGCDGCPVYDEYNLDDDGNPNCREDVLSRFLKQYSDEFEALE